MGDEALESTGPQRLDRRVAALEERISELQATVEAALVAQASRIERMLERLGAVDVRQTRGASEPSSGAEAATSEAPTDSTATPFDPATVRDVLREELRSRAEEFERRAAEATRRVDDRSDEAAASLQTEMNRLLTPLTSQLATTVDGVAALAETLRGLERSLLAYLHDHDRRVAIERADLVRQFVEQLAEGLTRRERRRLALKLPFPDDSPPDEDVVDRLREVVRSAPEPVPAKTEGVASSPPSSAPSAVDEKAPVMPSRRQRPVRVRPSKPNDPTSLRRALAAIPGVGPAKQSELIDRFGTLDGIRTASDEELLEIPGIGPSLLATIREALR